MDTDYQISSSKMENQPIMDTQCCVNLTSSTTDNSTESGRNSCSLKNPVKRCVIIYMVELFFTVSILCFSAFMIYLTYTSNYFQKIPHQERSTFVEPSPNGESRSQDLSNLYQYTFTDQLRRLSPQLYSIILQIDQSRLKRDVDIRPCYENIEHCKNVIDSMWTVVSVVNNSIPHLQAFIKNVSTNTDGTKSKFVELVECLQCKNDSIAFIDESGPEKLANDKRITYEHSDHAQIKYNVDTVANLLNGNGHDANEAKSEETASLSKESDEDNIRMSTTVIYDDNRRKEDLEWTTKEIGTRSTTLIYDEKRKKEDLEWTTKEIETRSTTIRTMEYESNSTEAEVINATTSASTKTEETTGRMDGIDDTTQTMVTVNVTVEPYGGNVTEIANTTVHPSVHPSGQGQGEQGQEEREVPGSANRSEFRNMHGRIVSKPTMGSAAGAIPTAETMKSTQQLQLTPTMSWMPYQVCFYGPQPNGQMKQTSPGQFMYPSSAPGRPFAASMPQQRQGFQNSNQAPNFVQVQANSVQFLPNSFQGNNWQAGNQRIGPTGPGAQNFPTFPGQQAAPSGGSNFAGNNKSPYYCTYIPAPTFQFPAIPGVSEYQRSGDTSGKQDGWRNAAGENKTDHQRGPASQYVEMCPANMIRCADGGRCILRSQWCNGEVDCNDASDETTCSCRDRVPQERLCDGYFDCPHGEDELGCLGCPRTSFSCNDWQRRYTAENCVPLSQRCDGVEQCANGKDEMECNVLTPSFIEGKNVFTIGYNVGYLHKNFKGQWYPVCTAIDSWAKEACISEVGPEISAMPEVKIHSVPDYTYEGPYLTEVNGQMELVPSCMNTAIFVRCPQFPCGTRVLSREDSILPYALDKNSLNSLGPIEEILWRYLGDKLDLRYRRNDTNSTNDEEMVSSQMRVVGGRASQPKAWPFLVAIYKDGLFYCGGVILNELWVLTAAHCLDGYMGHYFEIQAGMLRRFSFSPMRQFRKARYTVVHPMYSTTDMSNDLGMIMLDEPLHFNRWVRPACLPGRDILGAMWRNKPEPNTNCVAIGWGATRERGPDPDHMREVELPILETCKHEIDQHEATICAGYHKGGRDACQGDSGGPLMCRNPYSESQWYVAGIISHGEGCARPNEPGTYTRVSYFLSWIQEVSSGRGVPPTRRTPLEKCPGFSCGGGLGKCLPIDSRCNKIVECLDGEDEVNCHVHYPLHRNSNNADSKSVSPVEINNSTTPGNAVTTDSTILYRTPDASMSEEEMNNEVESDEETTSSTTFGPNQAEKGSTLAPAVVPQTVFTCTRLIQTISINKRCDRVVDCEDSTDEMNCTCKDYLTNIKPSAICDDYTDCDDLTDEQDCAICGEHEFFCRRSKACISMSKRCDVKFDCEYKEDELDCFTLTNGHRVYLDADKRPSMNTEGILTRYVEGRWEPTCHHARIQNNQSTATLIGQNMCEYFGFAKLQSSEPIRVKNSVLETVPWSKNNSTSESSSSAASLDKEKETCSGLYIRCTPILNGNVYTYHRDHNEQRPWLAGIYVDGEFQCSALLLDQDWLLTAAKCLENVRLEENYTVADMGYDIAFRHIEGPHQQTVMIDEIHVVNNSVAVLLHLRDSVTFSRQVQPLFLDRKIYLPGMQDTCEAIGSNKNETRSVTVRPILQNCSSCQRCFADVSNDECLGSETSEWSGTIFCRGKTGWYPAIVFQDNRGLCSFKDAKTITSIDYINPYFTEVTDSPRESTIIDKSTCGGFRCKNGQCVPGNRVCDEVPDCRDQADEDTEYCKEFRGLCETATNNCSCTRTQLRCNNGKCVDKSVFCDGFPDCSDGSDEPTLCTCAQYLKLTTPERLCDGVRHCLDKTDESPEICPCRDTSFTCKTTIGNGTCIPQDFICDGEKDCSDGEDEAKCKMLKPRSENSGTPSEVISRSYGVWHSECFPSPFSSDEDASNLCKLMGFSSGKMNDETTITDEPVISRLDDFYLVKINSWTWMSLRNNKPLVSLEKTNETCHRAFVDCV